MSEDIPHHKALRTPVGTESILRHECFSKAISQRALHEPRLGQSRCEFSKRGTVGETDVASTVVCKSLKRTHIESRFVCDVDGFPVEPHCLRFRNPPAFGKAGVDTKVAGASEGVALARFSRISKTVSLNCRDGIAEEIWSTVYQKCARRTRWANLHRSRSEATVRRKKEPRFDRNGKAAGPPDQP